MSEETPQKSIQRILMDIGAVQMAIGLIAMLYFLFFDPDDVLISLFLVFLGFSVFVGGANFGLFRVTKGQRNDQ